MQDIQSNLLFLSKYNKNQQISISSCGLFSVQRQYPLGMESFIRRFITFDGRVKTHEQIQRLYQTTMHMLDVQILSLIDVKSMSVSRWNAIESNHFGKTIQELLTLFDLMVASQHGIQQLEQQYDDVDFHSVSTTISGYIELRQQRITELRQVYELLCKKPSSSSNEPTSDFKKDSDQSQEKELIMSNPL